MKLLAVWKCSFVHHPLPYWQIHELTTHFSNILRTKRHNHQNHLNHHPPHIEYASVMKHQTTGWTSIWKQTIFGAIIARAHPIAPCQNALQDDSFAKSKTNINNQMNRVIIVPGRRRTLKTEHTPNVNSIEISSLGETETERRWLNFRWLLCAADRGSERIRAIDFNLNEMKWNEIEWSAIYANILSDHKCCLLPEHKIFISIEWNSKRTHNDFEISFEKWVPHHHHHHEE